MINTNIWLSDSIKLFISHYKYWKNWEDSTILIDPSYNIIWFFDRGTDNIDTVQSDLYFKGWFYIKNWEYKETDKLIKYIPYNYEIALKHYGSQINNFKQKKLKKELQELYDKIRKEVSEYNINYFKNLEYES
jgi:hypothetical protein